MYKKKLKKYRSLRRSLKSSEKYPRKEIIEENEDDDELERKLKSVYYYDPLQKKYFSKKRENLFNKISSNSINSYKKLDTIEILEIKKKFSNHTINMSDICRKVINLWKMFDIKQINDLNSVFLLKDLMSYSDFFAKFSHMLLKIYEYDKQEGYLYEFKFLQKTRNCFLVILLKFRPNLSLVSILINCYQIQNDEIVRLNKICVGNDVLLASKNNNMEIFNEEKEDNFYLILKTKDKTIFFEFELLFDDDKDLNRIQLKLPFKSFFLEGEECRQFYDSLVIISSENSSMIKLYNLKTNKLKLHSIAPYTVKMMLVDKLNKLIIIYTESQKFVVFNQRFQNKIVFLCTLVEEIQFLKSYQDNVEILIIRKTPSENKKEILMLLLFFRDERKSMEARYYKFGQDLVGSLNFNFYLGNTEIKNSFLLEESFFFLETEGKVIQNVRLFNLKNSEIFQFNFHKPKNIANTGSLIKILDSYYYFIETCDNFTILKRKI